jgi:dihydrodipicolinate synthase/N-acetylneuraminate lyase
MRFLADEGVGAAIVTAIRSDGRLERDRLERRIQRQELNPVVLIVLRRRGPVH